MAHDPPTPDVERERLGTDVQPDDASTSTVGDDADAPWHEEQVRAARKRAIIWGLGGGIIMSLLLVGACALLLLAANAS